MNAKQIAIATDAINALDLGVVKTKLMHRASGEGWSPAHADAVEIEYRRFLTLMKLYPNEANAPLVDVDTFWHYHILDTAKYAADSAGAFGYFLHHYPYLGMDDDAGAAGRLAAGARTQSLYAATFGAAMPAGAAWCGAAAPQEAGPAVAWCGAATGKPASQALAWCGATTIKPVTAGLAWCGAATQAPAVAWCGGVATAPAEHTLAWCGAATSQRLQVSQDIVLTVTRAN